MYFFNFPCFSGAMERAIQYRMGTDLSSKVIITIIKHTVVDA